MRARLDLGAMGRDPRKHSGLMIRSRLPEPGRAPPAAPRGPLPSRRDSVLKPVVTALAAVALFACVLWVLGSLLGQDALGSTGEGDASDIARKRFSNAFGVFHGGAGAARGPRPVWAEAMTALHTRVSGGEGDVLAPVAGLPRSPRLCARDMLLAGLVQDDAAALRTAIAVAVELQGKKRDAATGEEPGKVHLCMCVCVLDGGCARLSECV